jgi:hypothetical protein
VQNQVSETIGTLAGLSSILRSNRADYLWDIVIPTSLVAVRRSLDGTTEEISSALRNCNAAVARADASIRSAFEFFSESNLSQLPLLSRARALGIRSVTIKMEPKFKIELN